MERVGAESSPESVQPRYRVRVCFRALLCIRNGGLLCRVCLYGVQCTEYALSSFLAAICYLITCVDTILEQPTRRQVAGSRVLSRLCSTEYLCGYYHACIDRNARGQKGYMVDIVDTILSWFLYMQITLHIPRGIDDTPSLSYLTRLYSGFNQTHLFSKLSKQPAIYGIHSY